MREYHVLAIDLGASNGRILHLYTGGDRLLLEEVYRFPNAPVRMNGRRYTDILRIYSEILEGLKKAYRLRPHYDSLAIDSWGVDFGLLDANGDLLHTPLHYRDTDADVAFPMAEDLFGRGGLFYETGVQDMWYNTVYQILCMRQRCPSYFRDADCLLLIADLLAYFLTGEKSAEYTAASTTQIFDVAKNKWSGKIAEGLGLSRSLFPRVVNTGSIKGEISDAVRREIGMPEDERLVVVASPAHDSAAAAFGVPAMTGNYMFINSGTWSVLGMVRDGALVTEKVYQKGYSNEGAAYGKVKLVKSVMGMWLIQELRKSWERQGKDISYAFLTRAASGASPFSFFLDVDCPDFVAPDDMEAAIRSYCRRTGQGDISTQGQMYRAVMESLAFTYREAVEDMEQISGQEVDQLYLLGGAVRDASFCSYIANATGKTVYAGPVEATAIGNAFVQLKSLGLPFDDRERARLLTESFDVRVYQPETQAEWDRMYCRYKEVIR